MKNLFKILTPLVIVISIISCVTAAATDSYRYNDSNQGYSAEYMDGYYRSPDGNWYAPNVIYSDYNGNSYRNGNVYRYNANTRNQSIRNNNSQRSVDRNPIKVQPQINTNQSGTRTQNNIRVQPNNNSNSGIRTQSQNNIRVQPQNNIRSENNIRVEPQKTENNNSPRSNGSR